MFHVKQSVEVFHVKRVKKEVEGDEEVEEYRIGFVPEFLNFGGYDIR